MSPMRGEFTQQLRQYYGEVLSISVCDSMVVKIKIIEGLMHIILLP
jgi:hypothetical protein